MNEPTTAVSLMRMALALLDRDGMTVAACHLEQAIHMASGEACADGRTSDQEVTTYIARVAGSQQSGASGG